MTKNDLISLLRDAEAVLWDSVSKGVVGAEETHQRIARALRADDAATADGACVSCGNALTQPSTGRPRMYCGEACKKRAYRSKRVQRES
jgi:ferredoxin